MKNLVFNITKEVCRKFNLSYTDLGKLMGITFASIPRWVSGTTILSPKHTEMLDVIYKMDKELFEEFKKYMTISKHKTGIELYAKYNIANDDLIASYSFIKFLLKEKL